MLNAEHESWEDTDWDLLISKKIAPLGNRIFLWNAQNEVIVYSYENGIFDIPSSIEIVNNLSKRGWKYDPKLDEIIKK